MGPSRTRMSRPPSFRRATRPACRAADVDHGQGAVTARRQADNARIREICSGFVDDRADLPLRYRVRPRCNRTKSGLLVDAERAGASSSASARARPGGHDRQDERAGGYFRSPMHPPSRPPRRARTRRLAASCEEGTDPQPCGPGAALAARPAPMFPRGGDDGDLVEIHRLALRAGHATVPAAVLSLLF